MERLIGLFAGWLGGSSAILGNFQHVGEGGWNWVLKDIEQRTNKHGMIVSLE